MSALLVITMSAGFTTVPALATELYSYQGQGGIMGQLGFYLIGGEYQIYVRAQLPIGVIRSPGRRAYIFSAVMEWPNASTVVLGQGTTITGFVPFKLQTILPKMSSGIYHFAVTPGSNCDW